MSAIFCRVLKQHLSDVGQKMKQSHGGKGSEIEPKHHHELCQADCVFARFPAGRLCFAKGILAEMWKQTLDPRKKDL